MTTLPTLLRSFSLLTLPCLLLSCASVSVHDEAVNASPDNVKPEKIYVRDFDISTAELNVDRTGDELAQFKTKTVEDLSLVIVAELLKFYPTERLRAADPTPAGNYLLLEGRITKINQGSRALRMVVGFGAGGTKMETDVVLYNVAVNPAKELLAFDTTGGSGAEPGMVTDPTPVGAAGSAAGGASRGVSDDAKRTSRMIAYRVSQYLGDYGWISPDQVKAAKIAK